MDTTELQNQAIEIRDAENEGENTALRVGNMLLAIIDAFTNIVDTDTLAQILEQYAMVVSAGGQIEPLQSRCIFLASMGAELDNVNGENWTYTPVNGHIIFNPEGNGRLQVVGQPGLLAVRSNTLYINSHSGHAYKWDPAEFKMVEITDTNLPTVITYKNTPAFSQVAIGESYVFQSQQSSVPKIAIKISSSETYSFLPDPKKIYAFRDIRQAMLWKPSNQTWVSLTPRVINDLTTGGEGDALSAEMGKFVGKILNAKDDTFYNVWVGTAAELEALADYEDNTIYLVGTIPTVVQRFNVSFNGGDHTSIPANTPQTVKEGSAFSVVVSPASGYTIDSATGTMTGGGIITKTNNQDGSVTFLTTSVTGAISIQAAASKHITSIGITAETRSGNSIPLTAVVAPSGADNVNLQWSVDDTTNFDISGSGTSATLTVKSGASNASVTITCQDANAASGTASGTLQLTGITYVDAPTPITAITDITATRTAANTLQLDATADGNTGITFSIVGTLPKVKKLDYTNSPATLEDVDNVVLNGNTMTYKEDCNVTVQASAENGTVIYQKVITITHNNADAIWFEDEVTLAALNSNGVGSSGKVTYAQAAAVTELKSLAGNTSIRRFKEFLWFTGITGAGPNASDKSKFTGCSNLECIGIPGTSFYFNGSSASLSPFYGCKLREVHIKSYAEYKLSLYNDAASWIRAGKSSEGLGLFINGEEVYDVVIPNGATVTKKYQGFNRITSFVAEHITSFPAGSLYGCTSLQSLKIGDNVTTFGDNAMGSTNYTITSLKTVDLGSGISALGSQALRGCTGLRKLTLRYDGVVTSNNSFYGAATISSIDLYVPASQVSAYRASSIWGGANSINAITE